MTIHLIEESSSRMGVYRNHPWNLIKTGFLVLAWTIYGFHVELIGPTLPSLAASIHVDYTDMSSALVLRGIGWFTANMLGILIQNIVKKYSDALLVLAFVLPAIVVSATPFVTSLTLICVLFFIQGVAQGFTDLGITNLLLTMWSVDAAAPLAAASFGYGIGAVLVNLLVRPFLPEECIPTNTTNNGAVNGTLSSMKIIKGNSSIAIPYLITGILCLCIAAGHLFFYIHDVRNRPLKPEVRQFDYGTLSTNTDSDSQLGDQETCSPYSPRTFGHGDFLYGLILSIIFTAYAFFLGAVLHIFSKYFFTYLKSERFHLSNNGASWGIILYWLSFSIGRLVGAIVSVFLSITMCLNIVWCGGLCLAIAWLVFESAMGLTSTSLFILGASTGLVFAPTYPLSFAFFNLQLNVTPVLLAVLLSGLALGAVVFQELAGYVMDHNPNQFPTLLIVCTMMSIVLYIISRVVHFFHERNLATKARQSMTNGAALALQSLHGQEEQ